MISVGDQIPAVTITVAAVNGQQSKPASELFAGKRAVLFAVPGAFTPTCSESHLPGFIVHADKILEKGVDLIACLSVNDAFVMNAWASSQNAEAITMLADGGAALTRAMGLEMDTGDFGGIRSQRYAMIIDDGRVTLLHIDPPGSFERSSAEAILAAL